MKRLLTTLLIVAAMALHALADSSVFIERMVEDSNVTVTYLSRAMLESRRYKDMMERLPFASKNATLASVQIYNCKTAASSAIAKDYISSLIREKRQEAKNVNMQPQLLMKSSEGGSSTLIYGFYRANDRYCFERILIFLTEKNTASLIDLNGFIPVDSMIIGN